MFLVKCINDSHKPESIPQSLFVVKGVEYTVVEVSTDMNGIEFYKLLEINLSVLQNSYKGFASYRFVKKENINKVVKQYQEVDA